MDKPPETPLPGSSEPPVRLPSRRITGLIAAVMLGIGVLLGAAIGPAPEASFAGGEAAARALPLVLAGIAAQERATSAAAAAAAAAAAEPPAVTPQATPAAAKKAHRKAAEAESSGAQENQAGQEEESSSSEEKEKAPQKKLPAITNVWLIQLAGTSFEAAESQPTAAPYIDTKLIPAATFLSGWSALQASAFASEAALAVPPSAGSAPPLLHSIVQPPCPEGTAGAACAAETPGQIAAADEFLKTTLATITGTAPYREHGLIVVTFASVGVASQSELPAGASTSTLTYQPPAGAAVLSPFAKAGVRSKASFNATSPRQSLEALLH